METQISQKRVLSVDFVKSIAIYLVIIIHICMYGFDNTCFSSNWLSTLFYDCLARPCVPLFFMCSGALLLNPAHDLPLKKLYGKNILHILIAMFFWAMFYKLFMAPDFTINRIISSIKETLTFKQEFHFYYLQILLIVYAFLPISRVFVKNANEKEVRYFLLFWLIFGIIYPTVNRFWPFTLITANGIPAQWAINSVYTSICYGILGWALLKKKPGVKTGIILTAVGFAIIFIPTLYFSYIQGGLCQWFFDESSFGICLMAAGVFILCLHTDKFTSRKNVEKIVTELSKASFCIYLVHLEWLYIFRHFGFTINIYPCIISIPIYGLVILGISYLTYLILHQIPIVKKWLI